MVYKLNRIKRDGQIMVVGCGGTGGFVAESLCRLLIGTEYTLVLVDHDRVETGNLERQNFIKDDLDKFKSKVLAERLASEYGREVSYSVSRIEDLPLNERGDLTIGCVDNPDARARLQIAGSYSMFYSSGYYSYSHFDGWYIDAGNGEHSGQVLIGNSFPEKLQRAFHPYTNFCYKLPLPQITQPELLAPSPEPVRRDCAENVARNEQSPVINQMMASLVLTFVHKLLTGSLTWMGAYIDLESGSLSTVDATPENVARITGHTVRQLEYHPQVRKDEGRERTALERARLGI